MNAQSVECKTSSPPHLSDEQHSCHDMLDEILGEIHEVVDDMCEATPEAEIDVDVPVTRCSLGLWMSQVPIPFSAPKHQSLGQTSW